MTQSRPLVVPPVRLRIIGWFWISLGIVTIATDLGTLYLGGPVEFDFAWFFPILGSRLIRFGHLATVTARALAWLGCLLTLVLTVFAVSQANPAAFAAGGFFVFFAWQLLVLYNENIKSLAVRGESKNKPRALVRIDLLSLFLATAVCAMSIVSLLALRIPDDTEAFSVSTASVEGATYTQAEPGQIGLFGKRTHGSVTMLTGLRSTTGGFSPSGRNPIRSFVSLNGKEFAVRTEEFGITVFDGHKIETSLERVPSSAFKRWVDSHPTEMSVQSLLDFVNAKNSATNVP